MSVPAGHYYGTIIIKYKSRKKFKLSKKNVLKWAVYVATHFIKHL